MIGWVVMFGEHRQQVAEGRFGDGLGRREGAHFGGRADLGPWGKGGAMVRFRRGRRIPTPLIDQTSTAGQASNGPRGTEKEPKRGQNYFALAEGGETE